jgi:HTH-type transcriptional repressor of NAD biosynthesis genes
MISGIKTIAILGGESTGKSTLSEHLAAHLHTVYTTEYGRDLWLEKKGQLVFADLLLIGEKQIELENELAKQANEYLICDTTPLTTLFYSLNSFDKADLKLKILAEREYDYTFLCQPDFPFVQDGARTGDEFRMLQDRWYREELEKRAIKYYEVSGSLEQRIMKILEVL